MSAYILLRISEASNRKGKGACPVSSRMVEWLDRLDLGLYFDFRLRR
jgi:hypothetical protein